MSGKPFTARDDATIRALWQSGASDKEIGTFIERSWQSVKARRLEKRWVAQAPSRDTFHPNRGALSCSDLQAFRVAAEHSTALLIERIEAGITNGTLRSPARAA